jgi:hypothetical protein
MTDAEETLVRSLRAEFERDCRAAKVPSASAVFWRASIRARGDAARTAETPLTLAAGIAVATLVGAGAAISAGAWTWLGAVAPWVTSTSTVAALCAAALLVISPLAVAALGSRTRFDRPPD